MVPAADLLNYTLREVVIRFGGIYALEKHAKTLRDLTLTAGTIAAAAISASVAGTGGGAGPEPGEAPVPAWDAGADPGTGDVDKAVFLAFRPGSDI